MLMGFSRRGFLLALAPALRAEMIVHSKRPQDIEMPLEGFKNWITPVDSFFVRSHNYTPSVTLAEWKLQIDGEVERPVALTMDDLKKLPRVELVGVLECAGNGRGFYRPQVAGTQWQWGSVGNARWTGVRLADVLKRAGIKASGREILFDGADEPLGTMPDFRRTITREKALHPDTLLAYEMNGQPLTPDHGFPLRVIPPGWAGDSWVKWLTHIQVLPQEYDGFWMKTAYRYPLHLGPPGVAVDPAAMRPVASLRVKSVIASPLDPYHADAAPVRVQGAAWSGPSPVTKVEISADSGRTWQSALLNPEKTPYGWRLWNATWTPKAPGFYTLMARAWDASGNTQPFVQEWNPSGYLWNVVPQVRLALGVEAVPVPSVTPKSTPPPAGFDTACLACHDMDMIDQQRLSRPQWEKELDKMIRWGAPVEPAQRSTMLDWLVSIFGPR